MGAAPRGGSAGLSAARGPPGCRTGPPHSNAAGQGASGLRTGFASLLLIHGAAKVSILQVTAGRDHCTRHGGGRSRRTPGPSSPGLGLSARTGDGGAGKVGREEVCKGSSNHHRMIRDFDMSDRQKEELGALYQKWRDPESYLSLTPMSTLSRKISLTFWDSDPV